MKKTDLIKLSIGQIGNALAFMVFFLFMPTYFKNDVFIGPLENTLSFLIITISFTAGAITYLFAGYLSDKTRTRWGKRRPFFLLVVPSGIAYIFLGFIFPISQISMFIFLSLLATIYAVLYRLEYCAYWSLYMDLTAPEERVTTSITFNLFGTLGTVAVLILTPILEELLPFSIITLLVGCIFIGSVLFAFFFGPKENLPEFREELKAQNLIETLKETISDRNFFYYLLASFFFVLGYSTSVLVLIPFLDAQSIDLLLMLPFIIPIAVFYFYFFNKLAKSRGKLHAFRFSLLIGIFTIPITIFLGLIGTGILLFIQIFLIIAIFLFVVIAILTFQYALLMDLSPPGREATYSGVYLFVIVIPIPIGSALVGPILDFLTFEFLIWPPGTLSFACIFLVTVFFIIISYFFLRKIQMKDQSPKK